MKRLNLLLCALLAVTALGSVIVASASAARPKINFLPGETFPVKFHSLPEEPNEIPTELQNASGVLTGKGLSLEGTYENAAGGKFAANFLNVKKGTTVCTGTGSPEGQVKTEGPFKSVHDVTATSGDALLFEPNTVTVLCGAVKIEIKGTLVALVAEEASEKGKFVTKVLGLLHCSTTIGEPFDTKYWEEAATELHPLLLANFGTGFKKACEEINTNAEKNGMLEIDLKPDVEFEN